MARVLEHSEARGVTRMVLVVLANHEGHHEGLGDCSWPSLDLQAKEAHCSRQAVIDAHKKARQLGELSIQEKAGPKGTNLYRVLSGLHPEASPDSGPPQMGEVKIDHAKLDPNHKEPTTSLTQPKEQVQDQEPKALPDSVREQREADFQKVRAAAERVRNALAPPETLDEEQERLAKNRRPHPAQFNYVEVACLERLQELDPAWNAVAWSVMQRLLGQFGHEVLTMSLQECWESRARPRNPVPYLIKVCEGIRRKRLSAGGGLTQGSLPSDASVGAEASTPLDAHSHRTTLAESPGDTVARLGKEERTGSTGTPPTHFPPARAVASFSRRYTWRMVEDGGEL